MSNLDMNRIKILSILKQPYIRLLLIVVTGVCAYVLYDSGTIGARYSDADPAFNAGYWKSQIAAQGSAKAFALFKQKNESAPSQRQHFSAHVFGSVLAEHDGVEGITSCDSSFGFGCYHGFFSKIISEGGETYIKKLDDACVKVYGPFGTGCQHGIGHGILEYVGYERVQDALRLCGDTTQRVPLLGCTSGVFMEYFTPLVQTGELLSQGQRAFDEARPQAPCDVVTAPFKESCFFELGHSYYTRFAADQKRLTQLCESVPAPYRSYCYLGLGDLAGPSSHYRVEQAIAFCDAFSGVGRVACRAGVAWSFFANPAYRSQGTDICTLNSPQETAECKRLADLTLGQANQ